MNKRNQQENQDQQASERKSGRVEKMLSVLKTVVLIQRVSIWLDKLLSALGDV